MKHRQDPLRISLWSLKELFISKDNHDKGALLMTFLNDLNDIHIYSQFRCWVDYLLQTTILMWYLWINNGYHDKGTLLMTFLYKWHSYNFYWQTLSRLFTSNNKFRNDMNDKTYSSSSRSKIPVMCYACMSLYQH